MRIKSTVAEATKYSDDALEAFYTAVDNGQARLALLILVDVIEEFASRFDALDAPVEQEVALPKEVKVEAKIEPEEVKPADIKQVEEKSAPKAKTATKETSAE